MVLRIPIRVLIRRHTSTLGQEVTSRFDKFEEGISVEWDVRNAPWAVLESTISCEQLSLFSQ